MLIRDIEHVVRPCVPVMDAIPEPDGGDNWCGEREIHLHEDAEIAIAEAEQLFFLVFSRIRAFHLDCLRQQRTEIFSLVIVTYPNDEVLIVCAESDAEAIKAFIGPEIEVNWDEENQPQPMISRRIVVTNSSMNGKSLGKMHFSSLYGVNITRITRQGMDLFASRNHHFHVGDRVMVVGPEENVNRVAELMGNSEKRLNAPNIATIFVGIIVGLIFGSLPIAIPGMPVPMKLGLAGGPLIIAILIGRFGYRMGLVTYTTTSANMMLREFGLVLFLASVGIKAGNGFWETVVAGDGLKYVYTGFIITVIPILIVATIARLKYKFNYFTIMGMISGAYTDPPALAYANSECIGEASAVGYSTVYPLSMFLRILTAQIIVLFFCGV